MSKKVLIYAAAALFVAALAGVPHQGRALTLTPAIMEVDLTAGQKSLATIDVTNDTTKVMKLETAVYNFTAKGDTGEPDFNFTAPESDLASWIAVDQGPINLKAGATQTVNVVFNTPSTAAAGGHYAAVFMKEVGAAGTGTVKIESMLGTLFLATVKGTYVESGSVAAFGLTANQTSFREGPIAFEMQFQNTGDVHLKPSGTVVIKNMFSKDVASLVINKDKGATLPKSTRTYDASSWDSVGKAFGKYTATLNMTAGTVTITKTVTFWVWSSAGVTTAIVIVVAIVILLVIVVVMLRRKSSGAAAMPISQPKK
ncbi:MAG: hypothetical protein V1916_00875 [Patescibacteria group bacterium]